MARQVANERPPGHAPHRRQVDGRARDGLTRPQAGAQLRRLMATVHAAPAAGERLDVAEAARRYLIHAERHSRKPSTRQNIESEVRVRLAPFFRGRSLDGIRPEDVYDLVTVLEAGGLSPKSIRNVIGTLSALFNFAKTPQRRWATANRARASTSRLSPR
jgi:hypothetical protein